MDPLSEVLSLLKLRSYVSAGFDAAGDWSIRFPQHEGVKLYAVVRGECWLAMDRAPDAVRLRTGDGFLLPTGRPFRLTSDLALTPLDAKAFFPPASADGIARANGGGDFFLVGSLFTLAASHASILLGGLPPIVHIRSASEQAALRWSIERMMQELREQQPGSFLVAQHLAHMMLVHALRLQVAEGMHGGVGLLYALADEQVGATIGAMHEDPAHRWTLQELATRIGMSRSSFALRFKAAAGTSPMEYLTRWRMLLAEDKLTNSSDSISAIAFSLGYESESAFSTAFKRIVGASPRRYARDRALASTARGAAPIVGNNRLQPLAG